MTDGAEVSIRSLPRKPYLEVAEGAQLLHVDFVVRNETNDPLVLSEIAVTVIHNGQVIHRRHIDDNGLPSGIATIPGFPVDPGRSVTVFNPLERYPRDLPLTSLRFEFVLGTLDGERHRREWVEVTPLPMPAPADLVLPVRGRMLVHEAHDYYGHHRRVDLLHPVISDLGLAHNSSRFSYDLSLVDEQGRMFRGRGHSNDDWYSWGQPVRAAGSGIVVACATDRHDFDIGSPGFRIPDGPVPDPSIFLGNHVTILHPDGTYTMTGHLRQGSVTVQPKDRVRAGDHIGLVGFSGSCVTVHTHFQRQAGSSFDSEGIPCHFTCFRRLRGPNAVDVRNGPIDSGEIVQALA